MGKRVSAENQNEAAMQLVNSLIAIEGVTGEVLSRTSGTQTRNIAHLQCEPSSWRKVAETMKYDHEVDHCSMITGIHWPESSDKNWEVIYHFLRTGVKDPDITEDGSSIIPNITEPKKLSGKEVPLEIQDKNSAATKVPQHIPTATLIPVRISGREFGKITCLSICFLDAPNE